MSLINKEYHKISDEPLMFKYYTMIYTVLIIEPQLVTNVSLDRRVLKDRFMSSKNRFYCTTEQFPYEDGASKYLN